MAERYIGFNDTTGNDCNYYTHTDAYEDTLEDVLRREIDSRGGLLAMMEPCTEPNFAGHFRVVITIGPEEPEDDDEGAE